MDNDKTGETGQANARNSSSNREGVISQDERLATLIFSAVLTLFGLFWIYASADLPSRQQTAYLSQGFMPLAAGLLLAALSAVLFWNTWRTKSRPAAELGREPLFEPKAEARGAAVFGILLIYILILPHIHYLISTFLLMAAGLYLARERFGWRLFLLAAATSGLFFLIFVWGLQVALPGSEFG